MKIAMSKKRGAKRVKMPQVEFDLKAINEIKKRKRVKQSKFKPSKKRR